MEVVAFCCCSFSIYRHPYRHTVTYLVRPVKTVAWVVKRWAISVSRWLEISSYRRGGKIWILFIVCRWYARIASSRGKLYIYSHPWHSLCVWGFTFYWSFFIDLQLGFNVCYWVAYLGKGKSIPGLPDVMCFCHRDWGFQLFSRSDWRFDTKVVR